MVCCSSAAVYLVFIFRYQNGFGRPSLRFYNCRAVHKTVRLWHALGWTCFCRHTVFRRSEKISVHQLLLFKGHTHKLPEKLQSLYSETQKQQLDRNGHCSQSRDGGTGHQLQLLDLS